MELFEIGSVFTTVWNTFFVPVVQFAIVIGVVRFILGSDFFNELHSNMAEFDGILFKKKNGIYRPVTSIHRRICQMVKSNNVFCFVILLCLVYAMHELIFWVAQIFPLTYYYSSVNLLLFSASEHTIASIWSYCPDLSFSELPELILQRSTDRYTAPTHFFEVNSLCIFILVISIILLFVSFHKKVKRLKRKRILVTVLLSLTVMAIAYLYNFSHIVNNVEQNCYYVLHHYQVENSNTPANDIYLDCLYKVEKEKDYRANSDHNEVFGFRFKPNIDFQQLYKLTRTISFKK